MGEMKSAWEIAMERVEKLGKLPPEELKRQKEEEYAQKAHLLAEKYFGGLGLWQLEIELEKYSSTEIEGIKKALTSKLIQAVELGNHERLRKAIEGIAHFGPGEGIKQGEGEISQLFEEYQQAEYKEKERIEGTAKDALHQLRISGSAVGAINPRATNEWQQDLDKFAQPYKERLEQIKQKLITAL